MDVCAIPASSVPCEWPFSAGAEIATDRRSRLGSDKFEQLQVLKHAWRNSIVDMAATNSSIVEQVTLCRNSWSLCWSTMTWSSGIRMRVS